MKLLAITIPLLVPTLLMAGQVEIKEVRSRMDTGGLYRFDVTLEHADTGWKHYADGWEVLTIDGALLGTRTLYHPHVDEQPFTRSLSGVAIPANTRELLIRAHDKVHGDTLIKYRLE
ncbi:MAG: hypothetical protein GY703_23460 [Gammaproteobacteria bacterium]|nr:hypothetical protein [Gammaproteobacteria bacterium]